MLVAFLTHVDKIACLNRKLYYHGPVEYAAEGLKKIYKCTGRTVDP